MTASEVLDFAAELGVRPARVRVARHVFLDTLREHDQQRNWSVPVEVSIRPGIDPWAFHVRGVLFSTDLQLTTEAFVIDEVRR